jgi:hypothetical protein
MKRRSLFIGAAAFMVAVVPGALVVGSAVADAGSPAASTDVHVHSAKASTESFDQGLRKLWEDHITWTRLFIVSASSDLPDLPATTDRLLRNQSDIGDAIKPFYGDAAGAQLTSLLRTHILTAADIIAAAKAGDDAAVQQATTAWYANADQIASFLASANPKQWPFAEMQSMMHEHLDLTLAEAVAHLQGRFTDDIAAYDQVHQQILGMADMLANGIERQFPSHFTSQSTGQ